MKTALNTQVQKIHSPTAAQLKKLTSIVHRLALCTAVTLANTLPIAFALPPKPIDELIVDKPDKSSPLAHLFAGDDGGAYYVTEVGDTVYWFAEHPGRKYAHVFRGTRNGNTIAGKFWGVPKYEDPAHGTLTVKVNPNGSMARTAVSGDFPTRNFDVSSINGVKEKLPGKTAFPGFTNTGVDDLDGVFDDAKGYRYYIRQLGDAVVGFAENGTKTGDRPDAAIVFVAQRNGSSVVGTATAVIKGTKTGHGKWQLMVKPDRTLLKQSGVAFGGGPLLPVIPEIRVPVKEVMNLVNAQLNKIEIRLDGYDKDGHPAKKASFVKFGKETHPFDLPMFEVKLGLGKHPIKRRTFINDMNSDIIHLKPLGGASGRLTILFETGGREIKRYALGLLGKNKGDGGIQDDNMPDFDLIEPRIDLTFNLINATSNGKPSVSIKATDVSFHFDANGPGAVDGILDREVKKNKPVIVKEVTAGINAPKVRAMIADEVCEQLTKLESYLAKYNKYGFDVTQLAPKSVSIDGDDVVFSFK